jgi:uncharacterized protein YbjT (DUF2867 family)
MLSRPLLHERSRKTDFGGVACSIALLGHRDRWAVNKVRVAVAGGTGTVGQKVVDVLRRAGHEVSVLARSTGVDLVTGEGLTDSLQAVAVVVDVISAPVTSRRKSIGFFERTTTNLLAAERAAHVTHHLALSIVGVDRVDFGYYSGKRKQEELIRHADVPWTILRATQFHEFPAQLADRFSSPVLPVPVMTTQPVAAQEVAAALVDLALGPPSGFASELAGPDVQHLPDLVRRQLHADGSHRFVVPVRLPGRVGRALAAGALLPTDGGRRGTQTWSDWLAETRPNAPTGVSPTESM